MRLRRRCDHPAHHGIAAARGLFVAVGVVRLLMAIREDTMKTVIDERDLKSPFHGFEDFLVPIGQLVIGFGSLEQVIVACLGAVLRLSRGELRGLVKRVESTHDLLMILKDGINANLDDNPLRREALLMIPAIKHANEYRNKIVHDAWAGVSWGVSSNDPATRQQIAAHKLKDGRSILYRLDRMIAEIDNIVLLTHHLAYWMTTYNRSGVLPRPSLPSKSPQQLAQMT
jgi:hypothetical protein